MCVFVRTLMNKIEFEQSAGSGSSMVKWYVWVWWWSMIGNVLLLILLYVLSCFETTKNMGNKNGNQVWVYCRWCWWWRWWWWWWLWHSQFASCLVLWLLLSFTSWVDRLIVWWVCSECVCVCAQCRWGLTTPTTTSTTMLLLMMILSCAWVMMARRWRGDDTMMTVLY